MLFVMTTLYHIFSRYPTNSIDPNSHVSYTFVSYIVSRSPYHALYKPKGLPALPFLTVLLVTPGLEAMLAAPPATPVDRPRGLIFVVARLPAAPVTSLMELPYSRTISPQPRDVFAMLSFVSMVEQQNR